MPFSCLFGFDIMKNSGIEVYIMLTVKNKVVIKLVEYQIKVKWVLGKLCKNCIEEC